MNLTPHRLETSVWNRPGWDGTREAAGLSRWLVGVGGGALLLEGLRQRPQRKIFLGIGSSLALWALAGPDLSNARDWVGQLTERLPWRRHDVVHEASDDSFPASDPPSWTPTAGSRARPHRGR